MSAPVTIERVSVRPIRAGFAYADVRLPGVALNGIEARSDAQGRVTLTCPSKPGNGGRPWPIFALQPGTLEAVTQAVEAAWTHAIERSGGAI